MTLDPELQEFQRDLAESDLRANQSLLEGQIKWRRRNKYWFYWYTGFGSVEFILGTVDWLTGSSLFTILLTYGVALMQVPLAYLNRRSQRMYNQNVDRYTKKVAESREKLAQIDPHNLLLPEIIEEEP